MPQPSCPEAFPTEMPHILLQAFERQDRLSKFFKVYLKLQGSETGFNAI